MKSKAKRRKEDNVRPELIADRAQHFSEKAASFQFHCSSFSSCSEL